MIRFFSLLCLLLAAPAFAEPDTHPDTNVALFTDSAASADVVHLALQMTPKKGWHLYWKNYGDTGSATTVDFSGLPKAAIVADWQYPTPHRLPFGELMNYGYKQPITLLTDIRLPKNASAATVTAKAQWLACTEEVCVPESHDFTLTLGAQSATPPQTAKIFADARAALPAASAWPANFHLASGQFQLKITLPEISPEIKSVEFFPDTAPLIKHIAPQLALKDGNTIWLETQADVRTAPDTLNGVLVLVGADGTRQGHALSFRQTADALAPPPGAAILGDMPTASQTPTKPPLNFAVAFLFAVAGGLLLNLMPCVFPILALKAFALARSGESQAEARREGLAYTAGVLLTFAAVGGALLALRSGGAAIGWGFQLQDPRIVAALGLLMVAVSLNLAGLFEFGSRLGNIGSGLAHKSGASGAFWTGALAVIVATPCTAPFMAGALGAALALPPLAGMAVFLGLGLGMALPFLLLGVLPAFRRLLPKPGAWMESFRRFLAFPMLATALWLFWVVGQLTSTTGMAASLAAALLLALGLWFWGRAPVLVRGLGVVALLGAIAAPFFIGQVAPAAARVAPADQLAHEPYSDARLAALVRQGKPVFAYFTADWCISCKVNERVAIERAEVVSAFSKAGVVTLVGDWTRRDAALGKTLERHGRAGVPLYLYYPKGASLSAPQVLPQVLTPDLLITTVNGN